jgi:hypothetical protein
MWRAILVAGVALLTFAPAQVTATSTPYRALSPSPTAPTVPWTPAPESPSPSHTPAASDTGEATSHTGDEVSDTGGREVTDGTDEQAEQAIDAHYRSLGGPAGVLGAPTSPLTPLVGGYVKMYTKGRIYYSVATGAHDVRAGAMLDAYLRLGAETSRLGYPDGSEYPSGQPGVLVQHFHHGRLYHSSRTGTNAVYDVILTRYLALAGPEGVLGLPTRPESATNPAGARVSEFERGRIYWSPTTGAWEVTGVFLSYYVRMGGPAGALGLPTSTSYTTGAARAQNFGTGRVYHNVVTGTHGVYGRTLARYLQLGGPQGVLRLPTSSEHAGRRAGVRVTHFQRGRVWYSSRTGAREVLGATLGKYLAIGAESSWIGLPNAYHRATSYGDWQGFQHASIQYYRSKRKAYVRLSWSKAVRKAWRSDVRYSYRSGCPLGPSRLRVVRIPFRNWALDDQYGTVIVRARVVDDIAAVFKSAHARTWAIRRVHPVDRYKGSDLASMRADNTSAFNCRKVTGNPYRLSRHSYGDAIDINPFENPYVTARRVYPEGSRTYLNRKNYRKGMLRRGDAVESVMRRQGWPWGGRWRYPDYQHFSENGA